MAEIFKSVGRNSSVPAMRGFYVMRMKQDERTGHYFGVATWISKDQPLPGARAIVPPEPVQKIELEGHSKSEQINPIVEHDSGKASQIEDSRSEFNQTVEKLSVERRPGRSLFDPYDSNEF